MLKGHMLIFASLCGLLYWNHVDSMRIHLTSVNLGLDNVTLKDGDQGKYSNIPLNMVDESVDDMYFGCKSQMISIIRDNYFKKENKGIFADVWKKAEKCAKDKLPAGNEIDKALTSSDIQAICVFTSNYKEFFSTFNRAVRTSRKDYGSSFPFHFLHFWLTSAVRIVSKHTGCKTTYRRTKDVYTSKGKLMRFGSFASSSTLPDLKQFGNKTCFIIRTCFGASVKNLSVYGQEAEVIIPPYEFFEITRKRKKRKIMPDCEKVYNLKHAGELSNLNCKIAKKRKSQWIEVSV